MFRPNKRHTRRPSARLAATRVEALLNNPSFKYSVPTNISRSV
jgi:hypothetical protein